MDEEKEETIQSIKSILNQTFAVTFSVDLSGYISLYIDWPDENNRGEMLEPISQLLLSIESGGTKNLISDALRNTTIKNPELKSYVASLILKWAENKGQDKDNPVIKPRNTFHK